MTPSNAGAQLASTPLTLREYGDRARERMDRPVWDFLQGGAGEERTLEANQQAFDRARLQPSVLSGVSESDLRVEILGRTWGAPLAIAPMACHTLVHPDGEVATAAAAGSRGVPFVASMLAGRTFTDIAAATTAPLWLQVYCLRDRAVTADVVERAVDAGVEALVLTVDTPRLGRRLRDVRNQFRLPDGIAPANLAGDVGSPSGHAREQFDPNLDWTVVEWLRSIAGLPILLKGILSARDARAALAAGVDGIVVSNHGGRQLDGVPATLEALPAVVAEVAGACPVLIDGGIRRGSDVLTALALGADAVLLGRPVLHGLAVGGRAGVEQILDIVTAELDDALVLTGTAAATQAGPGLVWPTGRPGTGAVLAKEDLHASLSDPLLDTMNFLNEVTRRYPDAISFAPGRPYDGFFDTEEIFTHIRRYLRHLEAAGSSPEQIRGALFQYGPTSGQIRELIAGSLLQDEGIDVPAESIVVTVGAQEAMFLAVRALIAHPNDVLLVSSPCYVGISGAASLLGAPVAAVAEGPDGLSCASVERVIQEQRALGRRPRAIYVIPDHSNPSGVTMGLAERHELIALAARHEILILEDSPYRMVSRGVQEPTLKSLDPDRRVVHLGSYSKTLFPGARLGFVVADQVVASAAGGTTLLAHELAKIKSMITVNTSPLSQAVVGGMLLSVGGRTARWNERPSAFYAESLAATLNGLENAFSARERAELGVEWNAPTGGFFLSVRVPFVASNEALSRSAADFGVLWTPMSYFYPEGGGEFGLRLSTSYLTPADIDEGIARLTAFIRAEAERSVPATRPRKG